ncbi:hypothetical protein IU438_06945 [Nocardia cyriacigeorgica]|uniref:hypothetical protein n=1 Tax=Nocardia cyriacigeorgica TaxID=135487 RepID=UPI00189429E6|nr:hypothetical protein [Nocardia cyriacigeorgica]MBF6086812.1 hypothetical protein [Nocardia cyriacigeorgica]MBF6090863.1 hypothetical protein [Nocardia cyriacigeorgica]MBF6395525.1 hypothetical protein [Nocardia cyriacigeorgica]MBF6401157.1 hypothetical protein [Nocardia cyriacigeorgica]
MDLVTADAGRYAGLVLTGVPENFSMQGFRGTAPHMGKRPPLQVTEKYCVTGLFIARTSFDLRIPCSNLVNVDGDKGSSKM